LSNANLTDSEVEASPPIFSQLLYNQPQPPKMAAVSSHPPKYLRL
jgi:hypothetical protein